MLWKESKHQYSRFYSSVFFWFPRRTAYLRPVIDFKLLNTFLSKKGVKMETCLNYSRCLNQGMWVFSIDLNDTYFHIPIHPPSRKFPRICNGKEVFQFKALPFGISLAPWLFKDLQTSGSDSQKEIYWPISRQPAELTVVHGQVSPGQTENTPPVQTTGLSRQLGQIGIEPHQLNFVGVNFYLLEGTV